MHDHHDSFNLNLRIVLVDGLYGVIKDELDAILLILLNNRTYEATLGVIAHCSACKDVLRRDGRTMEDE